MNRTFPIVAILSSVLAAGCATKKGFGNPVRFGCPIGEAKVASMDDLVKAKTVAEGRRTTIQATELRCSKSGELLKIDANLNNDSKSVKRDRLQVPLDRPRRHARLGRGGVEAADAPRELQPA